MNSGIRLLNKFVGKEQVKKKFVKSLDGHCKKGHSCRTEEEKFSIMKIDVPNTKSVINYVLQ